MEIYIRAYLCPEITRSLQVSQVFDNKYNSKCSVRGSRILNISKDAGVRDRTRHIKYTVPSINGVVLFTLHFRLRTYTLLRSYPLGFSCPK